MTQPRQRKRTSLDVLALNADALPDPTEVQENQPPPARSTRTRSVQQTAYLPPPVHEQLRQLAFEERVKMHDLLMEGLDLVFKTRGLPSINELKAVPDP